MLYYDFLMFFFSNIVYFDFLWHTVLYYDYFTTFFFYILYYEFLWL